MSTIIKTWPTLFKKNSDGKSYQQWTIIVGYTPAGYYIVKEYGQVGGKIQTSAPDIIHGKNIGKKNETSPQEQALLEAEAQWTKKQTGAKGYTPSMDDATAGVRSDLNSGGAAPMLAKTYGKMANDVFEPKDNDKIFFPCFGQPKLNGNRLIATLIDGTATLTSRDAKAVETVPHIKAALERKFPGMTITFDGEMYNHTLYEHLEYLRHMIAHGDEDVQYHIYDIVDKSMDFAGRTARLEDMFFGHAPAATIQLVPTFTLGSHERALSMFDTLRERQYEGLILRNANGAYGVGKRSFDLQKLKGWFDREFLITDVLEKGKGKDAGKAKFECITGPGDPVEGVYFKVDIAASQERRAEIYENPDDYLGEWLSVRFSYYTQDGKPFHAQGQEIRNESEANVS